MSDWREEMYEAAEKFGLPDVPEEGPGDFELVIFQFNGPSIVIAVDVTESDAQEYASREDTHGDGWFVGYRRQ